MWRTASILIGVVLLLVALGIVMLASTSAIQGEAHFHDPNYFMKRQLVALVLGFFAAAFATRFDYHFWQKLALPVTLVAVGLLVMVLVPGVGKVVNGSRRWLNLGGVTFQPSELAKFASVLLLSWWMGRVQRKAGDFVVGLFVPGVLLGGMAALILIEPDFGTTMLIATVGATIMFVGGSRPGHLIIAGAMGFTGILLMIMEDAERMRRIAAFLDPEKYAKDEAYQLLNAIYAFVVGGLTGVGLGGSLQKQFYLPEAHTDFIFAIIGEELGFAASIGVIVLFMTFFICGLRISLRASDMFGKLLAFGITAMITIQAAINMGVVTGCLPTKGLPMPFISYGGTSLAVTLLMVGVLVNIARHAAGDDSSSVKDRVHRL